MTAVKYLHKCQNLQVHCSSAIKTTCNSMLLFFVCWTRECWLSTGVFDFFWSVNGVHGCTCTQICKVSDIAGPLKKINNALDNVLCKSGLMKHGRFDSIFYARIARFSASLQWTQSVFLLFCCWLWDWIIDSNGYSALCVLWIIDSNWYSALCVLTAHIEERECCKAQWVYRPENSAIQKSSIDTEILVLCIKGAMHYRWSRIHTRGCCLMRVFSCSVSGECQFYQGKIHYQITDHN